MKKILLFLTLATLMASCTIDDTKTYDLIADQINWTHFDKEGLNGYYSSTFDVLDLTQNVYANGQVQVYIDLNGALAPLPYVRHFEQSNGYHWTETIDYEYSEGTITIFVCRNDFIQVAPSTMYFKAVLSW